jgi:hypothetical protein
MSEQINKYIKRMGDVERRKMGRIKQIGKKFPARWYCSGTQAPSRLPHILYCLLYGAFLLCVENFTISELNVRL